MLQGQTAAPGNLSGLCFLQTWMSLTLALRPLSELFLHAGLGEQSGAFIFPSKSAIRCAACCDADSGGQHADAQKWAHRMTRRENICRSALHSIHQLHQNKLTGNEASVAEVYK